MAELGWTGAGDISAVDDRRYTEPSYFGVGRCNQEDKWIMSNSNKFVSFFEYKYVMRRRYV